MAGFTQIIEFTTSHPDEMRKLGDDFRAAREARGEGPMPLRMTVAEDRDRPGTYLNIVEFASYDDAMENSRRSDTSEMAARMAELCDGPPRFLNLDVVDGWAR